ncbi:MAG: hypothetical protein V2J24_12225, partial [Pseudomonadales bacterium]|nr:hypothetical protein [Pseudomonadales bacterium]
MGAPRRYRYSIWDGSQADRFPSADAVMEQLADDLMQFGDLRSALRNLLQRGMDGGDNPMGGLRDLLRQLRQERRQRLERYDLSGIMDDIRAKLEEILALERGTLEALRDGRTPDPVLRSDAGNVPVDPFAGPLRPWPERRASEPDASASADDAASAGADGVPPSTDGGEGEGRAGVREEGFADSLMGGIARRNLAELDALPQDPAGAVRALSDYEFVEPQAQRKYEELVEQLREAMTKTFFRDVEKMIREMSDGDLQR